jgi:hypothetical protein
MLGGFSGCQRPNSEATGAGKKAGACPDEAQSTVEAVGFWTGKWNTTRPADDADVHSDAPSDTLGRNADFGMRAKPVDSHFKREVGSAQSLSVKV